MANTHARRASDRTALVVCLVALGATIAYPTVRLLIAAAAQWRWEAVLEGAGRTALINTVAMGLASVVAAGALGGGLAFAVFLFALGIAGAHVVLLALPLHGLLCLSGCRPGVSTVLISAAIIGALPAALLFDIDVGLWGGLFGLIGGGAFCAVSVRRGGECQ